jgi:gamma-glutamyltranspeptidase/glutathione hydrolase
MVCSIDHLASSAGIAMLRAGGTAADAAVAASGVLAVTTQHACGMGGDLFALVHDGDGPPAALRSAGPAGSGASAASMRAEGLARVPMRGDIRAVTVPGCVDGWLALHRRFGRLPLADVLAPAAGYASQGFPASPLLCAAVRLIDDVSGADDYTAAAPLRPGRIVRRPGVADALAAIVAGGRDGFYGGPFGAGLIALGGGLYSDDDLRAPIAAWVDPIAVRAWEHDVWTVPPPSQGYIALGAAWIASGLPLPADPDEAAWVHLLVEAAKWAGHDRESVLHDRADGAALVSPERLAPRRDAITVDERSAPPGIGQDGGTIHLCVVDRDRMGVSLIQSNASGWGAHIVEPATRIFLQDRGIGFSLADGHPAELAPRRMPRHTLSPALVTRPDGSLRSVLGTMGGDSQTQIVLQLLARTLHAGESPGKAISAPRWRLGDGGFAVWEGGADLVALEPDAPGSWERGLAARSHPVERVDMGPVGGFGHAHLIEVGDGALAGAADPRAITGAAVGC